MTTTFFSYNALVSQRASGYRNTTFALAELIDNAFDAEAGHVTVVFLEKRIDNLRRVDEVLVLDDGYGMNSQTLQGALQFGNTTNSDLDEAVAKRKKGKFGYGLPNASLSQCPAIHVYSWQGGRPPQRVYLDLNELKQTQSIEIPDVEEAVFEPYYAAVLPELGRAGTLVSWRRCDRLSNTKGDTIARNSLPVLGRLYRHLLNAGKKVTFRVFLYNPARRTFTQDNSDFSVTPNDPMFLLENTQLAPTLWKAAHSDDASEKTASHYRLYSIDEKRCKPTNEKLVDKCYSYTFEWLGRNFEFEIVTSCAVLDIQKPGISGGGNTQVGNWYGRKEREGNISFVRADREIAAGHFGFYKATDARHRWWSIEVKFNADADDLLGVHNNKQGIEFLFTARAKNDGGDDPFEKHTAGVLQAREELWIELSKRIEDARKEAFARVKKQHTKWEAENPPGPESDSERSKVPGWTPVTQDVVKKVDGTRARLTNQQLLDLESRLVEKYPDVSPDGIRNAVDALDRSLVRACVLYAPSESSQLWSFTRVFDFLVVLVNSNHEFYTRVLTELRTNGQEGSLSAIELFISSLAVEEEKFVTREDAKDVIEEFRSLVGLHLHNYIRRLPDSVKIVDISEEGEDADE